MYQRKINLGDYLEFNNKMYVVSQDSDGRPLLLRYYISSQDMLNESQQNLQRTLEKIQVSTNIWMK